MRRIATFAAAYLVATAACAAGESLAVIPAPASVARHAGAFAVSRATPIVVEAPASVAGGAPALLADWVARSNGLALAIRAGAARDRAINLSVDESLAARGPEAYRVDVTPSRITLAAATREGLVHAVATLWQLIAPAAARVL